MVIFQSELYFFFFYSTMLIQDITLYFLLAVANTVDVCPLFHLAIFIPYCFSFQLLASYKFSVTLTVPFTFY